MLWMWLECTSPLPGDLFWSTEIPEISVHFIWTGHKMHHNCHGYMGIIMKENGEEAAAERKRGVGVSGERTERRKIRFWLGVYRGENRVNTLPLMKKKQWRSEKGSGSTQIIKLYLLNLEFPIRSDVICRHKPLLQSLNSLFGHLLLRRWPQTIRNYTDSIKWC